MRDANGKGLFNVVGNPRSSYTDTTKFIGYQPQQPKTALPANNKWGNILKGLSIGGGLLSLAGYANNDLNFSPALTEDSARSLLSSVGANANRGINQQLGNAMSSVASQYAARGLGSSGAVTGDIAGLGMQAAESKEMVNAELNKQLLGILQYIDQRNLAMAQQEQGKMDDMLSSLSEMGLMLPFIL